MKYGKVLFPQKRLPSSEYLPCLWASPRGMEMT